MAVNVLFQPPVVRRERHFRGFDPLEREFSDEELRQRYRFGRGTIAYLSDLMRGDLERGTNKETALSVEQQVMIALRFYGSGSHLQVVGDTMGFDKSTVSRVINRVTDALVAMKDDFISWPDNQRKNVIRAGFYEKAGFPNVFGCIDGTHIRITGSSIDEPAFVNRKGFHSINIRMKPDKACRIIIACGILHNIAIMRNEPEVAEEQLIDNQPPMPPYNGPQDGKGIRDHFATTFFA
ncbi:putative nuclease HARBI1 [Mytilus edulis]|uniref:putative nuclease HARBI1 n=1 Tax=Mytilus edulis TaxID=6550 RepID=UPI0039F0D228